MGKDTRRGERGEKREVEEEKLCMVIVVNLLIFMDTLVRKRKDGGLLKIVKKVSSQLQDLIDVLV